MIKNTAGQKVGAQMVSATDGSAFTGSVTVSVTVDAGTQATGSVGSGAATHEGNGYQTYAPAQAETNGDLIAFTFTGTGAVPQTVQVYTRAAAPDVNVTQISGDSTAADNLESYTDGTTPMPVNATQISGDATAADNLEAAADGTGYNLGGGSVVAASVTGAVGSIASGGITAASFGANAITAATLDPDVTTELQAGLATAAALSTLDGKVVVIDGIVDDILVDTAEIGAAGAGLTNINLPNQTMDIVGSITGNLSGSVGSVTGAVGSVTGAVGSVTGSIGSLGAQAKLDVNAEADTAINDAALATAANLATVAGYLDTEMAATLAAVLNLVSAGYTRTGTAQAGAATSITLDAGASAVDDFYNNQLVVIASGTGAGQARFISDYVGATKVATVPTWATNPDNTSVFFLLPFGAIPGATAPTAAEVRQEMDANSTQLAAIVADTNELQTDWVNGGRLDVILDARASQASVDDLPTNAELTTALGSADDATLAAVAAAQTVIDAIDAKTTNLPSDPADQSLIIVATDAIMSRLGAPAGVSVSADVAAVKSQTAAIETDTQDIQNRLGTPSDLGSGATVAGNLVDIEAQTDDIGTAGVGLTALASAANLATVDTVVDSILALLDDPRTEPGQGAPPVNPDLATKVDYLFKLMRNRITQTSTELKVYADDGTTVDHKATVSDDGTTYDRSELATGA